MGQNTFTKSEKLKSIRIIGELFKSGDTITVLPLKIIWKINRDNTRIVPARMTVGVPSRNFKKSVDRNLIKRRIREAYRLNKHNLFYFLSENKFSLDFVLLYLPKSICSYQEIEKGVCRIIEILINQLKSFSGHENK